VTAFLVILDAALTLAAGAALSGLVRTHLTLMERAAIGITSGLLISSGATYGLSLVAGLDTAIVMLGPALTLAGALAVSLLTVNPRATWHASWMEAKDRWARHIPWFSILAFAGGGAAVIAIFAHTVYSDAGGLEAGYPTVWADWSQHLTTAASFPAPSLATAGHLGLRHVARPSGPRRPPSRRFPRVNRNSRGDRIIGHRRQHLHAPPHRLPPPAACDLTIARRSFFMPAIAAL